MKSLVARLLFGLCFFFLVDCSPVCEVEAAAAQTGNPGPSVLPAEGTNALVIGPTEKWLLSEIERLRGELASLDRADPKYLFIEKTLARTEANLIDHRHNQQLWRNLNQARTGRKRSEISRAEAELSSYLATKLGERKGVSYPTNMELSKVVDEYDRFLGNPVPWRGKRAVIFAMFLLILVAPPALLLLQKVRNSRRPPGE